MFRWVALALCVSVLIVSPLTEAKAGGAAVGVREIVSTNSEAAQVAQNLQGMLETSLVAEFGRIDERERPCDAVVVELDPKVREQVRKELELQKSADFDPATRVTENFTVPDTYVEGGVTVSNGVVTYIFDVVGPDGKKIASVEGRGRPDETLELNDRIAKELAERICLHKSWHVQASYNDLQIAEDVCDITEPFTLHGKGETAGIEFRMVPISGGLAGSFTIGGTAGGVPWSGQGLYSVDVDDKQRDGRMPIEGSWQIKTPVGVFGDQGTIPAQMVAISCG